MAERGEALGVKKAALPWVSTLVLGILGGAFIAIGALFATTVVAGGAALAYGVKQLLAGLVFSLGLLLVLVGGAELFTGSTMLVMAWAGGKLRLRRLLANWALVYAANFVGASMTAALVFLSGQYRNGNGAVGAAALGIAAHKVELGFAQAVAAGILCNALVCLAVWLSYSARSTADRVLAIVPPVAAFVAAGFEHSVANMYFLPLALAVKWWAPAAFWQSIGKAPTDFAGLTVDGFLRANLLPVTIGNIIGGGVMVAGVYWFVYLRRRVEATPAR
jgi:formate/nitrite transporter